MRDRDAKIMNMRGHRLCRPPVGGTKMERWDHENEMWIPDDGKPGYAFSGQAEEGHPAFYSTKCARSHFFDCIFSKASNRTCDRFGAANGSVVLPLKRRR
jgi:hypothetical protein